MKVLCVIDSLGSGGAQRQIVCLARGLKDLGHEVEIFVYHKHWFFREVLEEAGIPIHFYEKKWRYSLGPPVALRQLIKKGGYAAVIAFLSTPIVYVELATLGLKNIRVVVSERSISPDGRMSFRLFLKSLLHLQASFVIPNTFYQASWMRKRFWWIRNRIGTIVNGVNVRDFCPSPCPIISSNNELYFIGVGRICAAKNIPTFVHAIAQLLREEKLRFRIDWVGRVDDESIYVESQALLNEYELEGRWRWLGEREDVASLLKEYDVLVLPSLWEGSPNAIFEAMASGLPVLASRISDIPRFVQDGVTGFLFNPKEMNSIVSCIKKFLCLSGKERSQMGEKAREVALQDLSLERYVQAFDRLLVEGRLNRNESI